MRRCGIIVPSRKRRIVLMEPTKKMLIMNILDILKRYSDANHTLSQKDIIVKLKKD